MSEHGLRRYARRLRRAGILEYPMRAVEWLFLGGRTVEALLLFALSAHYKSRFRRDWLWRKEAPHFFNNRIGAFSALFGGQASGPYGLYRGFLSFELVQPGDALLDIGCGDGFFTKHFLSTGCKRVDAVDIEPSAIAAARRDNPAPNIHYHLLDAVGEPFPTERYDVIVWDGAIGHFPADTTDRMLQKIAAALASNGVFAGSESLGMEEGHDHLQFFDSIGDIDRLFKRIFAHRNYRVAHYRVGGFVRREVYWRCSNSVDWMARGWQTVAD
jgi:SAM-dependent methyltransferase